MSHPNDGPLDGSRYYFDRTPPGTCPDPIATPVRSVSEFASGNRRFNYLTLAQAVEIYRSLQVVLYPSMRSDVPWAGRAPLPPAPPLLAEAPPARAIPQEAPCPPAS